MNTTVILLVIEVLAIIFILVPTAQAYIFGAPFVPTPMERVKKMIELSKISKGERLYDLGCGDGRLIHHATETYGADAVGFELTPFVYAIAKIRQMLWRSKDKIYFRDFRKANLSDAKVIVFYLLPDVLRVLRKKFEAELKPGTLIISYAFAVDGWEPTYVEPKIPERNLSRILVYEIGKTQGKNP